MTMHSPPSSPPPGTFAGLIQQEFAHLEQRQGQGPGTDCAGATGGTAGVTFGEGRVAGEPWVRFTGKDWFGLSLSGGGVRSATFNLGLLQGLDRLGILRHIDYLSTVSGGGYAGGFWSAWLARQGSESHRFPTAPSASDGEPREAEAPAVRHLREHSRFLMPRLGVQFEETRLAVVAILAGMVPALLAASSVIVVVLAAFAVVLAVALQVGAPGTLWHGAAVMAASAGLAHVVLEQRAARRLRVACRPLVGALALAVSSGGVWWGLRFVWADEWSIAGPVQWQYLLRGDATTLQLFFPSLVLLTTGGVFVLIRFIWASIRPGKIAAGQNVDVILARCLFGAAATAALSAVWWTADGLVGTGTLGLKPDHPLAAGGALTTGAVAIFLALRSWLLEPRADTAATGLKDQLIGWLKPSAPQLAALVAVFALGTTLALILRDYPWVLGVAGGLLLLCLFVCSPAEVGLHDFYRTRLARAYLGASRVPDDPATAAPETPPEDDLKLGRMDCPPFAPIHLICCAANTLAADPLPTLYRGARSATLSRFGLHVAGHHGPVRDELTLSSAMTASAAAFNSQMGAISMSLGPAVGFLMTALNLRLGLWVPHPARADFLRHRLVGWSFFQELFGRSTIDGSALHLSDGGHFENLALYELVRRHCRFILLSDCSADPEVAFDDLANALRRIREDFGVEVEIDIEPLRPGPDGRSAQHAVLGTIHYNGSAGADKGAIIYFKPTLTGDEPADVLQYRTRNVAFPHESTGDQFYDGAQWESYRRLGEHAAHAAFRFLESSRKDVSGITSPADYLFNEAALRWSRDRSRLSERFLELTTRIGELETDVREQAPATLLQQFFPEALPGGGVETLQEDDATTLFFLMRIAQLMEDVWVAAELEENWAHPLNAGWMSYFHRWAAVPLFRYWWPVIRANYSVGFRDFVRDRFDLRTRRDGAQAHQASLQLAVAATPAELEAGVAVKQWMARHGRPVWSPELQGVLQCYLILPKLAGAPPPRRIQVGLVRYRCTAATVEWSVNDFFVPPQLSGAGITGRFLRSVIEHFAVGGAAAGLAARLRVELNPTAATMNEAGANPRGTQLRALSEATALGGEGRRTDRGHRMEKVQTISFYKSRGFEYSSSECLSLDLTRVRPRVPPDVPGQAQVADLAVPAPPP